MTRQQEIIECMFHAWVNNDMPLYGGLSLGEAFDCMKLIGIDTTIGEQKLAEIEKRMNNDKN